MVFGRVRMGAIVWRPGRAREMKLYVGAWSGGDGGVFVASGNGQADFAPYQLPCGIEAGDSRGVAFAILADHLKDPGRAAALRGAFERAVGARLCGGFWTLRDSEVAEAIALIESGDRVT
jgi:hypothetical protein